MKCISVSTSFRKLYSTLWPTFAMQFSVTDRTVCLIHLISSKTVWSKVKVTCWSFCGPRSVLKPATKPLLRPEKKLKALVRQTEIRTLGVDSVGLWRADPFVGAWEAEAFAGQLFAEVCVVRSASWRLISCCCASCRVMSDSTMAHPPLAHGPRPPGFVAFSAAAGFF